MNMGTEQWWCALTADIAIRGLCWAKKGNSRIVPCGARHS